MIKLKNIKAAYGMRFRWFPFFILMIMLFTGLRLANLTADSSPDISISAAPFTDEALKAYSARNQYYFGKVKWSKRDGYQSWHKKSVLPYKLYSWWFELFGPSYGSIRILNVMFSVLTLVLLFFLIKRYYDTFQAFVALAIGGFSSFLIMFNRLGFYENLLNFFILLMFYAFCALYEYRGRMKQAVNDPSLNSVKQMGGMFFAVVIGCFATVAGLFTKQSISLVIISIIPFLTLYFFYSHQKLNSFIRYKFYVTILAIIAGYLVLGHFGFFDRFFKEILSIKVFDISLGYFLPLKRTSANFDSIYLSFIKSLFLEFVFIQPIIFFTGIYHALYSYYRFLYKNDLRILDTAFATWFLFGFLFLAIMRYHPARYYMLLSMPLVILSSRFFTSKENFSFNDLLEGVSGIFSFRRVIVLFFQFYFYLYCTVFILVAFVPFKARKAIYNYFYYNIIEGSWNRLFPIIGLVLVFIVFSVFGIWFAVKNIRKTVTFTQLKKILFIMMIAIQMFNYGKWYVKGEFKVVEYSRVLGKVLEPDSIMAGCWAPALGQETTLRTLVIQENMRYNVEFTESLATGKVNRLVPYRNSLLNSPQNSARPVYLTVSLNAPFDRKIVNHFKKYIVPERLLTVIQLGLFDVSIYRLDEIVDEKRRKKLEDEFKN